MRFNFKKYGFEPNGGDETLPTPDVSARRKVRGTMTKREMRGVVCNPLYVGIGPCQQQVPEVDWVRFAAQEIREHGPEQFLVNLIFVLRETIKTPQG